MSGANLFVSPERTSDDRSGSPPGVSAAGAVGPPLPPGREAVSAEETEWKLTKSASLFKPFLLAGWLVSGTGPGGLCAQNKPMYGADLETAPARPVARQWTELRLTAYRKSEGRRTPLPHAVVTATVRRLGGAARRYELRGGGREAVFTARIVFPQAGSYSVTCEMSPRGRDRPFATTVLVRVADSKLPPPEQGAVVVLTSRSEEVLVVDPGTLKVVGKVATAGEPLCACFDPRAGRLWLVVRGDGDPPVPTAVAYAAGDLTEQFRLSLPFLPAGIAAAGDRLFLADEKRDRVAWVDRGDSGPVTSVPVGPGPRRLLFLPDRRLLCVADADLADRDPYDSVSVVDVAKQEETVRLPVGRHPEVLALSADGSTLFVGSPSVDRVTAIDTQTWRISAVRSVPGGPVSLVALDQTHSVLALCRRKKAACRVDFTDPREIALLPLPAAPAQAARSDGSVFVCCPEAHLLLRFPVTGRGAVETRGVSSGPTAVFWRGGREMRARTSRGEQDPG